MLLPPVICPLRLMMAMPSSGSSSVVVKTLVRRRSRGGVVVMIGIGSDRGVSLFLLSPQCNRLISAG